MLSAAGGLRAGLVAEGPLPSRRDIRTLVDELLEVLFPESHRMGTNAGGLLGHVAGTIAALEPRLERAIYLGLHRQHRADKADGCHKKAAAITAKLLAALPDVRARLAKDVLAAFDSDPAASGIDEIVACYPGLYAIAIYRVANRLLALGGEVVPRMLTEYAHSRTGIDIHPGATIGASFFIDHGTGIVIGETSHIGDRVRVYQGVTLGALSVRHRSRAGKAPGKQAPPDHRGRRHDLRQRHDPGRQHRDRPWRGRRRQRLDHLLGTARDARRDRDLAGSRRRSRRAPSSSCATSRRRFSRRSARSVCCVCSRGTTRSSGRSSPV